MEFRICIKTIYELNKILDLRSENDIDLHVEQVRKKRVISIKDYSSSSLGMFKNEKFEELKKAKYNDFEDMVYRFQPTYDEIIDILEFKNFPITTTGYTLPSGMYEIIDNNFMLKSLLPKQINVNITVDDVRLRSNLTTNKTIKSTKKSFFCIILGLTQSHSDELGDVEGFIQITPGKYKSDRPINITAFYKVH